jgi:chromate transporter
VAAAPSTPAVPLRTVVREWGRIGLIGFGGPPAHVALLRELVVDRRGWIDAREFEDANAACGLLPGPASTQLSIYCARRVGGLRGALAGGLAFILPGLVAVLLIAAVALGGHPSAWVRGVGAGASAAVVAVVAQAGLLLARSSLAGRTGARLARGAAYLAAGAAAAALTGTWVVGVLLACGLIELGWRHPGGVGAGVPALAPLLGLRCGAALAALGGAAALPALAWTALKVGALSYGGGFVIIPLMQGDAVAAHRWMTHAEFADAVAYGQVTPGPVVHTVALVGWAAAGLGGALLAAAVAFAPSFLMVILGGDRFARLRESARARAFLDGAGPAAVGAIAGALVPIAGALREPWQLAVLAAAVVALALRRPAIAALLGGAAAGALAAAAGLPIPA